jgi:2-C-methyl-D-erythritol 4-phosphate cytidylyltransferase/2-C-methyl-D-erythritol 2,4-cyclodiphosphate synthase
MTNTDARSSVAAVIVAAGRGTRAGGGVPKQWRMLGGKSVAARTLDAFRSHQSIDRVILVVHPDDIGADYLPAVLPNDIVTGGATRTESVRAGLEALAGQADHVLIHDVARPLVSRAVIDRVIAALASHDGAAPALAVTDALWRGTDGIVTATADRTGLYRAQTPQGFAYDRILAAHRAFGGEASDDVEIARATGLNVAIVEGDPANIKITTESDFVRAEDLLASRKGTTMDIRVGNGFDVHRFGPGDHVTLCGVEVPHARGLQGHSDADVAMHAATDAVLGALAEGDIGRHFPPNDPHWKDAASHIFLTHAVTLATEKGFRISNMDITIICETPKIGPVAAAMQGEMARITGIEVDRISIKATTSERLGFTGRGEGIAAIATATLVSP